MSDQAEVNEVPCVATNCPWQPYFFGRKGDPAKGFNWTYLFFWGLEDVIAAFLALWDGAPTNKVVGGLFPNDADGNAWGDKERGLPPALAAAGYKLIDPGRYQLMNNDFSSQIAAFKAAGAEIVTGNMIPPDFATFWSQAAQQGFKPKIVTIGKALLFPSAVNVARRARQRPDLGNLVVAEPSVQVRPHRPERASSSPTPTTPPTKRPWTQPIGFQHALFEVAIDVLKRAKAIEPKAILDAIVATNYQSIVGPVQWTGKPVKNVTKTPLVAGQWQRKGDKFELVITANKPAPNIPVGGKLELLRSRYFVRHRPRSGDPSRASARIPDASRLHARPRGHDDELAAAMPAILALEKISKRFGAVVVADGIDLDARARARRSASSGRTAPARPRCSASSPARSRPTPAASCSRATTSPA